MSVPSRIPTHDEMRASYVALREDNRLIKTDRDRWFHAYQRLHADRDRLADTNTRLLELREQDRLRALDAAHESVVIVGHPDVGWPRLAPICRWLHVEHNSGGPLSELAGWVLGRRTP